MAIADKIVILPILIPFAAAMIIFASPRRWRYVKEAVTLFATAAALFITTVLFRRNIDYSVPWAGFGFDFSLRCYDFSSFIILAIAFFGFLIAVYSAAFLRRKRYAKLFYAYLLVTLSFASGAVLSENLVVFLFFWEGLLLTLFTMIAVGSPGAFKTATKAFVIVGLSDLCMMVGIALTGKIAGTLAMSQINIPLTGLGALAFILMITGAIAKAGSIPFHSWIPDAATDAPLPFMAILPAALEKLVGIYMLARISLDMFKYAPNSWASTLMMSVGAITIILAVSMALVQKDYKRLLSYHAISQVGYMILGVGTLVPAGIVGGLFHMINNALYKCCLFLTGGSVEKQAGTTDLNKLGGLWKKMPVTFACFVVTALAISGVPPFNGFFSKELVYDGALERGWIFYFLAVAGSFLTAASFLKLGHAAFLDKPRSDFKDTKEAPLSMLIPMITIAVICIIFGVWNALPIRGLIQPCVGAHRLEGLDFSGFPKNITLVLITAAVLIGALLNHIYGVKKGGSGLKAAEHIYHAPVLSYIYEKAEKGYFDPYDIGLKFTAAISKIAWAADRAVNWVYDNFSVKASFALTNIIRRLHTGNYSTYIIWSVAATAAIALFLIKGGF